MTDHTENLLWQFSLAYYQQDKAAKCLLLLQDEYGAEVNILLWCLWLGADGRLISAEDLASALALIGEHQNNYLLPMRKLRRALKNHPFDTVYKQAKSLELELERWEQQTLFELKVSPGCGPNAAQQNLLMYGEQLMRQEEPGQSYRSGLNLQLEQLLKYL